VRAYHSAALCTLGSATGMMVTFGGRTADQSALKDTWGLRRHRDGRWDWVKAPYKAGLEEPLARYQHSTIFVGTLMLVLGGRTNTVGENVQLEVYETESSEWRKFNSIMKLDLMELFQKVPSLVQKLEQTIGSKNQRSRSPNTASS